MMMMPLYTIERHWFLHSSCDTNRVWMSLLIHLHKTSRSFLIPAMSYGWQSETNEESKQLLKRDLFTQGLKLKGRRRYYRQPRCSLMLYIMLELLRNRRSKLLSCTRQRNPVSKIQHLWREYPQHHLPGETLGRLGKPCSSLTSSPVTGVQNWWNRGEPASSKMDKSPGLAT